MVLEVFPSLVSPNIYIPFIDPLANIIFRIVPVPD
jgi:hypothetical protein